MHKKAFLKGYFEKMAQATNMPQPSTSVTPTPQVNTKPQFSSNDAAVYNQAPPAPVSPWRSIVGGQNPTKQLLLQSSDMPIDPRMMNRIGSKPNPGNRREKEQWLDDRYRAITNAVGRGGSDSLGRQTVKGRDPWSPVVGGNDPMKQWLIQNAHPQSHMVPKPYDLASGNADRDERGLSEANSNLDAAHTAVTNTIGRAAQLGYPLDSIGDMAQLTPGQGLPDWGDKLNTPYNNQALWAYLAARQRDLSETPRPVPPELISYVTNQQAQARSGK